MRITTTLGGWLWDYYLNFALANWLMNITHILKRPLSAQFLAAVTIVSLLLSALPAAFFVALAANTDAVGNVSVTVVPNPATEGTEYFEVAFTGSGTLNLAGWKVFDTVSTTSLRYTFGAITLTSGQTFKVCGDQSLDVTCDADIANNVWNDSGDTLVLRDETNAEVLIVPWSSSTDEQEFFTRVEVDYGPLTPVACTPQTSVPGPTNIQNVDTSDYFATVNDALADCDTSDGDTIELLNNILIGSQITIARPIILDGNGFSISPTFTKTDNSNNSAIGVIGTSNVIINDLTIDGTGGADLHGINVFTSTGVNINDTTINNPKRTGVVVNGSTVTVNNLKTSGSTWHAINVNPGVGVTTPSVLTVNGTSVHGEAAPTPHIFIDNTSKDVTVNDTNNQYEIVYDGLNPDPRFPTINVRSLRLKTVIPPTPAPADATIIATKIVCDYESLLPNGGYLTIEGSTAAAFLASTPERTAGCRLMPDWNFEWALDGQDVTIDNLIGAQGGVWNLSGLTDANGVVSMTIPGSSLALASNRTIAVREVMKPNFLQFTGRNTDQSVSAEMYCSGDAFNYDNLEWIPGVAAGGTYHCVAWNVSTKLPETPQCINLLKNGSFETSVVENTNLWDIFTSVTGWMIEKVSGGAGQLELHKGWSNNQAANGAQYAELDGNESTKITQTVTTIPGATYELKWAFAGRHDIDASQNQLSVSVDGAQVATEGPVNGLANLLPATWKRSSYQFTADGSTNISFADAGPSDSYGTYLDDAQLCLVREPVPVATIVAEKVVCNSAAGLPNWNDGLNEAGDITANTAADWVAQSEGACRLVSAWEFEWAPANANDAGDTLVGPAGAPWTTFGATNASGITQVLLTGEQIGNGSHVWVREVLKDGYLPFNKGAKADTDENSAEIYCHTDGVNYDNFDRVDGIKTGETYHCVAFNYELPKPVEQCELTMYSDTGTVVVERNGYALATYVHENWTNSIPGATWIWNTFLADEIDEEEDQTFTFKETFTVNNPTFADLDIAADNDYEININGGAVEYPFSFQGDDSQFNDLQKDDLDIKSFLVSGNNVIEIKVKNYGENNRTSRQNPAGLLYKLVVKGDKGESCKVTTAPKVVLPTTGDIAITKYLCPANTPVTRSANGVGGSVPEGCALQTGATFGYVYGTQTNANDPYPELFAPIIPAGVTINGLLTISNLAATGRYLIVETNDNNEKLQAGDILGLYCEGDGDTSNTNDNQELTFVEAGETTNCVAYNNVAGDGDGDEGDGDEELPVVCSAGQVLVDNECQTPIEQCPDGSVRVGGSSECTLIPPVVTPDDNRRRSGDTGTRVSRRAPASLQSVLGAATDAAPFCPFLIDFMQMGTENDRMEVMKLQMFLNIFVASTPLTGVFDLTTDANVKAFQMRHKSEILTPWFTRGIVPNENPTGFVYKTTLWKINSIVCPDDAILPDF